MRFFNRSTLTVFLDVDGVIAPMGRNQPDLVRLEWGGWSGSVNYSPSVVKELLHLVEKHGADVDWLTSWQEEANECFYSLGMGDFKTHYDREDIEVWWKSKVVEKHLRQNPKARVVWLDDEIPKFFNPKYETTEWMLDEFEGRLLTISPDPMVGLTLVDLKTVADFMER